MPRTKPITEYTHKDVLEVIAHLHKIRQVRSAMLLRTVYNELRNCLAASNRRL